MTRQRWLFAGLAAVGLGAALLAMYLGRSSESEPLGDLTLRLSSASSGAQVVVRWEGERKAQGALPVVVSVPLERVIEVSATHSKFKPYRQELILSRSVPEATIVLALEEQTNAGDHGLRASELPPPERLGFRAQLGERRDDRPDAVFESSGVGGGLIVDHAARVWRYTMERDGSGARYWAVGQVDREQFVRMSSLANKAQYGPLVPGDDRCRDCGGVTVRAFLAPDGKYPVTLALDGESVANRDSPEARILLGWILALRRSAPYYDPANPPRSGYSSR